MIDLYKTINLQTAKPPRVKIYGIERDYTQPDPTWTRTDAAVGKTATVSVGDVAGHSDFDNCYPWSKMKRETFPTGDVMVKIPEFYYQRTRDGNIERIRIANKPVAGFDKHPGSGCYISAYSVRSTNQKFFSKRGEMPQHSDEVGGLSKLQPLITAKGSGWSLTSYQLYSAIAMLYLVEFATNDTVFGDDIYTNKKVPNGEADNVPNLTGVTAGKVMTVYRGIEEWFGYNGMPFEIKATANRRGVTYQIDGEYVSISRVNGSPGYGEMGYVKNVSFIKNKPWITLPCEAGVSRGTYYAAATAVYSGFNDKDEYNYIFGYGGDSSMKTVGVRLTLYVLGRIRIMYKN